MKNMINTVSEKAQAFYQNHKFAIGYVAGVVAVTGLTLIAEEVLKTVRVAKNNVIEAEMRAEFGENTHMAFLRDGRIIPVQKDTSAV